MKESLTLPRTFDALSLDRCLALWFPLYVGGSLYICIMKTCSHFRFCIQRISYSKNKVTSVYLHLLWFLTPIKASRNFKQPTLFMTTTWPVLSVVQLDSFHQSKTSVYFLSSLCIQLLAPSQQRWTSQCVTWYRYNVPVSPRYATSNDLKDPSNDSSHCKGQ